jgi:hypothetical protein
MRTFEDGQILLRIRWNAIIFRVPVSVAFIFSVLLIIREDRNMTCTVILTFWNLLLDCEILDDNFRNNYILMDRLNLLLNWELSRKLLFNQDVFWSLLLDWELSWKLLFNQDVFWSLLLGWEFY